MFDLNKEQLEKLNKWIKEGNRHNSRSVDGARLMYSFIPTSIGTVCKVKDCVKNEEIDLSDYENW